MLFLAFSENLDQILQDPADEPRADALLDSLINQDEIPIYFTRIPQQLGPLSEIPGMMAMKEKVSQIIYSQLEYVQVRPSDFGLPFSSEARELMTWILEEIDKFTRGTVKGLTTKLETHLASALSQATNLNELYVSIKRAKDGVHNLSRLGTSAEDEGVDSSVVTTLELVQSVYDVITSSGLHVQIEPPVWTQLMDQDRFISLLKNITGAEPAISRSKWVQPLQRSFDKIQELSDRIHFLMDLDRSLCNHMTAGNEPGDTCEPTLITTRNPESLYVSHENQQRFVLQLASFLNFSIVPPEVEGEEVQDLTTRFLNRMVHRAVDRRRDNIRNILSRLAEAQVNYLTEAGATTASHAELEQLWRKMDTVMAVVEDLEEAATTLPEISPSQCAQAVRNAWGRIGEIADMADDAAGSIEMYEKISGVLGTLNPSLQHVNANNTAVAAMAVLKELVTDSKEWFEFFGKLDTALSKYQLQNPVRRTNTSTAPMYLQRSRVLGAIQELSTMLSIELPLNDMDPASFQPFLFTLNDIVYQASEQRRAEIDASLQSISTHLVELYKNIATNSSDIGELLKDTRTARNAFQALVSTNQAAWTGNDSSTQLAGAISHVLRQVNIEIPQVGDVLSHIATQDQVLDCIKVASPQLGAVQISGRLQSLSIIMRHLEQRYNWYEFLTKLEDQVETIGFRQRRKISPANVSSSAVTSNNWFEAIRELSVAVHVNITMNELGIRNVVEIQTMVNYAQELVHFAHSSRLLEVQELMEELVKRHLATEFFEKANSDMDAQAFKEETEMWIQTLQNFDAAVGQTSISVAELVNATQGALLELSMVNNSTNAILQSVWDQERILQPLHSLSENLSKLENQHVLGPVRSFQQKLGNILSWYKILDQIAPLMCGPNKTSVDNPPMLADSGNVLPALQAIANHFNLSLPMATSNPSTQRVFLTELNNIFYETWVTTVNEISTIVQSISNRLKDYYETQIPSIQNVTDFNAKLERVQGAITGLLLTGRQSTFRPLPSAMAKLISEGLSNILHHVPGASQMLEQLSQKDQKLLLMSNVSPMLTQADPQKSMAALEDTALNFVQTTLHWYRFMVGLDSRSSDHNVQKNREWFNVQNISDWGKPRKPQGLRINNENAQAFVRLASGSFSLAEPTGYREYFEAVGEKTAFSHLNQLINRTLDRSATWMVNVSEGTITVKGHYVLLSEVMLHVNGDTKRVEVYAHHTFFVDTNVNAVTATGRSSFDLIVIARRFVSVSAHTLDLTGSIGPSSTSTDGIHGSPGLPGGNGGAFILLTEAVTGSPLNVISNGGRGGDSAGGARGPQGGNGISVKSDNWGSFWGKGCSPRQPVEIEVRSNFRVSFIRHLCPYDVCSQVVYAIHGAKGSAGGKGGNGGKGGAGGSAGTVKIIIVGESKDMSLIKVTAKNGANGQNGPGGPGGMGGRHGKNLYITFRRKLSVDTERFRGNKHPYSVQFKCEYMPDFSLVGGEDDESREDDGPPGTTGAYSGGWVPSAKNELDMASVQSSVEVYVTQSVNYVSDVFAKLSFENFVRRLNGVTL